MHQVLIMNPTKPRGRKKTRKGTTPMAKKKKPAKKQAPAKKSNPAKKAATKRKQKATAKKGVYKHRNPRPKKIAKRIEYMLPTALGGTVSFVGARAATNYFIPGISGYVRAVAQAGGGFAAGMLLEMLMGKKKKIQQISDGMAVGGMIAGGVTALTEALPGYSDMVMSGYRPVRYVPKSRNVGRYIRDLPDVQQLGRYTQQPRATASAGMGHYMSTGYMQ